MPIQDTRFPYPMVSDSAVEKQKPVVNRVTNKTSTGEEASPYLKPVYNFRGALNSVNTSSAMQRNFDVIRFLMQAGNNSKRGNENLSKLRVATNIGAPVGADYYDPRRHTVALAGRPMPTIAGHETGHGDTTWMLSPRNIGYRLSSWIHPALPAYLNEFQANNKVRRAMSIALKDDPQLLSDWQKLFTQTTVPGIRSHTMARVPMFANIGGQALGGLTGLAMGNGGLLSRLNSANAFRKTFGDNAERLTDQITVNSLPGKLLTMIRERYVTPGLHREQSPEHVKRERDMAARLYNYAKQHGFNDSDAPYSGIRPYIRNAKYLVQAGLNPYMEMASSFNRSFKDAYNQSKALANKARANYNASRQPNISGPQYGQPGYIAPQYQYLRNLVDTFEQSPNQANVLSNGQVRGNIMGAYSEDILDLAERASLPPTDPSYITPEQVTQTLPKLYELYNGDYPAIVNIEGSSPNSGVQANVVPAWGIDSIMNATTPAEKVQQGDIWEREQRAPIIRK